MGSPNLAGPVPPAPDLADIASSPYADKSKRAPSQPEGIGLANKGAQVVSGITGVLQGLQQGFAQKQVDKFNRAKTDYSISKAQYDAASQRVAQLKAQGADPNSDEFKSAQAHLDQATSELSEHTKSLVDLAHGGGGKGKNADPAHQGLIGKAMDTLMGKVPVSEHTPTFSPGSSVPPGHTVTAPSPTANPFAAPSPNPVGNVSL